MSASVWLYALGAASIVAGWWVWSRFRAKDYAREKMYSIRSPFPLIGAPDLVRQVDGGELEIHDLKTRSRAVWHESDKIQLSLYKLLVERATGRSVSGKGYIRARVAGQPDRLLAIVLYSELEMVALYDRYIALLDGREAARFAKSAALCGLCGFYKTRCFPPDKPSGKSAAKEKGPAGAGPKSKR